MSGYTKGVQTEILTLRPSPIQVSWFGYLSTSGATFMDYFIADNIYSPPKLPNVYTEQLAFTKHTIFVVDHKHTYQKMLMFFCNLNKLYKILHNIF